MQTGVSPINLGTGMLPDVLGGRINSAEMLRHNTGNAAAGGIWKVTGPNGCAVYKLAQPPQTDGGGSPSRQTSDEARHWNYWKREYLAYTDGVAEQVYVSAGIVAPRLLSVEKRPDGKIGLWLAWASGAPATDWPVARYIDFARQLGAGQARWVNRVPDQPWFSRRWLRQYLAGRPNPVEMDWNHPTARIWPEPVRRRLAELWQHRERVLDIAERSARTLCHLDVWPSNLVAEGADTVLIDWSFVGDGAIGEDISNLIFDTFADGLVDEELITDLSGGVVEAYATGLINGGWTGSIDDVRASVAATGAAKYCWYAPALVSQVTRNRSVGSKDYGHDTGAQEMFTRLTGLMTLLADWTETALALS